MKKTITALAMAGAATSAMALIAPDKPEGTPKDRVICLASFADSNYLLGVKTCDESQNNIFHKKTILANGCAEFQAAIKITEWVDENGMVLSSNTGIKVPLCRQPNITQL